MKISLNWLNDYVDVQNEDKTKMAESITRAGVNIEGIKTYHIDNLVVGYVEQIEKHPNSDHLNVCMVDIGEQDLTQIVCGAPNVDKGQKVIVAKIGAVLGADFKIKKSTIRGIESNGMLCALEELGLEEKSDGIYILNDEAKVGSDPFIYLGLSDTVYDLDLNPNRNDCLSHLGFAYEAAAVLDKKVQLPPVNFNPIEKSIVDIMQLDVETDNCQLYYGCIVEDITVGESPSFIKERLASVGMRSINNVVDISNYVMLEYGQPLHFYDKDKLGNHVLVRMAENKEETITLDGIKRSLNNNDIVITDGKQIVSIAGVMGCQNTEVNDTTKTIFIESAIFNPFNTRYTSINLDLRSEASLRNEKSLNPDYTLLAINRACHLLEQYANGKVYKNKLIYNNIDNTPKKVTVSKEKINKVLGMELTDNDILEALRKLSFEVDINNDEYLVTIPNRRRDVSIKEDIIEEIGRLYGYDNIRPKMPNMPIKRGSYNTSAKFRKDISKYLRGYGLNEVKTYTLISEEQSHMFNYRFQEHITVNKPISNDKTVIRQTIVPSLINVVNYNLTHETNDIFIYEISNTYSFDDKYKETLKLAFALKGNYITNNWSHEGITVDFYLVKGMIEELFDYLGYKDRLSFAKTDLIPIELHPGVSCEIFIDNSSIGYFGMLHPQSKLDNTFVGEINIDDLMNKKTKVLKYKELSKYPSIIKDMAFIVDRDINSDTIIKTIKKKGGHHLVNVTIFDIYTGNKIDDDKKSIAFSLEFKDENRTLNDEEIMTLFNQIIDEVKVKHNAILRDQ